MNFSIFLLYVVVCGGRISANASRTNFSSVSLSYHTQQLYQDLYNEERPTRNDPAQSSTTMRERICESVAGGRYFRWLRWLPLSPRMIQRYHVQPGYSSIFDQMFSPKYFIDRKVTYVYTNVYRPLTFRTLYPAGRFVEHVFVCPLEDFDNKEPLTFYISKEYNVGMPGQYLAGRFVFGNRVGIAPIDSLVEVSYVLLAEQPAHAYYNTHPSFNAEVHYLRVRKHIQPAESNSVDPLCRLVSSNVEDFNNRHRRLCVSIATSSDFVNKTKPPATFNACQRKEITFRTAEGMQMAAGKSYYERMTLCNFSPMKPEDGDILLYLSRAYASNAVFVYYLADGKIYLKNMSTNIAVLDELNSFDFPED